MCKISVQCALNGYTKKDAHHREKRKSYLTPAFKLRQMTLSKKQKNWKIYQHKMCFQKIAQQRKEPLRRYTVTFCLSSTKQVCGLPRRRSHVREELANQTSS